MLVKSYRAHLEILFRQRTMETPELASILAQFLLLQGSNNTTPVSRWHTAIMA
jgi:hypothetical protein